MSAIEDEILVRVRKLPQDAQQQVLNFVTQLEQTGQTLSPKEIMNLPATERERYVRAAFEAAQDETFEIFEA